MTKASMALAELAEKGRDSDIVRELVGHVVQRKNSDGTWTNRGPVENMYYAKDIDVPTDVTPTGTNDEGNDPVSPLHIRLLFRHPSIDPATISAALGVQPTRQWRVGDRVTAPNGKRLRGFERDSSWGFHTIYQGEPNLEDCVNELLQVLRPHSTFVRQLTAESYVAELILSFPGQLYIGGSIAPATVREIGALGLSLGIEIFPDSAT